MDRNRRIRSAIAAVGLSALAVGFVAGSALAQLKGVTAPMHAPTISTPGIGAVGVSPSLSPSLSPGLSPSLSPSPPATAAPAPVESAPAAAAAAPAYVVRLRCEVAPQDWSCRDPGYVPDSGTGDDGVCRCERDYCYDHYDPAYGYTRRICEK